MLGEAQMRGEDLLCRLGGRLQSKEKNSSQEWKGEIKKIGMHALWQKNKIRLRMLRPHYSDTM